MRMFCLTSKATGAACLVITATSLVLACAEQAGKTCTPGGLTRPCALYGEGEKIDGGCPAAACPYVMDTCYCDDCSTGDM